MKDDFNMNNKSSGFEATNSGVLAKMKRAAKNGDAREFYKLYHNYLEKEDALNARFFEISHLMQKLYFSPQRLERKYHQSVKNLTEKVLAQHKLSILFLNDVGFNAGAGIALKRQAESFFEYGHQISLVCCRDNAISELDLKKFKSIKCYSVTEGINRRFATKKTEDKIIKTILEVDPDVVITGNLHAFNLSIKLTKRIRSLGYPIFVYNHDLDLATGGCAHYLHYKCQQFMAGCNAENCLKPASRYPFTPTFLIDKNWKEREELLSKPELPLLTNSNWMVDELQSRFGRQVEKIPLALNTKIFKKYGRNDARSEYGLPHNKKIILCGSCTLGTLNKGFDIVLEVCESFNKDENILFVFYGNANNITLPQNAVSVGYIKDEIAMAKLYSACEVFLNPSSIESFGQTTLEAMACGCIPLALGLTGLQELIVNDFTAVKCDSTKASFVHKINKLLADEQEMDRIANNSQIVAAHFYNLHKQYFNWTKYFISYGLKYFEKNETLNLPIDKIVKCNCKVSIITPVYNAWDGFELTAGSIKSQKGVDLEWIIVDGGSEQDFINFTKKFNADIYIEGPDEGIYDAMNKGLSQASGDLVYFMGIGDILAGSSVLAEFISLWRKAGEPDCVIGDVFEVRTNGEVIKSNAMPFDEKYREITSNFENNPPMRGMPPHQGFICKTNFMREIRFNLEYKVSADWESFFRLYEAGATFERIEKVLAWYPNGGFSAKFSVNWLEDCRRMFSERSPDSVKLTRYMDSVIKRQEEFSKVRELEQNVIEQYKTCVGV